MITTTGRWRLLIGLVALLGLVAAACGDSDDDGDSSATTPAETTAAETTEGSDTTDAAPETTAATETTAAAGGEDGAASGDYLWVMVTDQAGLGDQGFNDLAFEGVTQAASELGGEPQAIESSEQAQYVPNLQQAVDSGASMTVGVGFLITDAMAEVAQANPDASFVLIDAVATDAAGEPLSNVQSVTFREQEAAYLAGIIAGMTTQSNQIGFAGGIEIPPVVRFLRGFEQGLASVNPDATVDVAYAGAFDDPAAVKELAAGFFDAGADIVFEVAGLGGLGAYEEATERGAGFWVIGTDTCKQHLAPENYLTSATKGVGTAVFLAAEAVADGSFQGGVSDLGIAEGAAGVCQDTFGDLPPEVQAAVEDAQAAIESGELTVSGE